MPGRTPWWKLVAVVPDRRVPATAGEGGWADGSDRERYPPRTRPADRGLFPGAGRARPDADRRPRRGRRAPRRQRRRQDHHAARDIGTAEAGQRDGPAGRRRSGGGLPDRASAPWHRARPARPRDLLRPDGGRALPAGRLEQPGRDGRRVRPLPGAARAARTQGRTAIRRRAADAGHRAGAQPRAEAADARRDEPGPGPGHRGPAAAGGTGRRYRPRDRRAAGRAARTPGAEDRRPGLHPVPRRTGGQRQRRGAEQGQRAARGQLPRRDRRFWLSRWPGLPLAGLAAAVRSAGRVPPSTGRAACA